MVYETGYQVAKQFDNQFFYLDEKMTELLYALYSVIISCTNTLFF